MPITRRQLLQRLAATGGAAATYGALAALGLGVPPSAFARPNLPAGLGRGRKVAVLGAGMAGLVSAWELRKAGFEVTVLEARDRVGGRNWSVRGGTRIESTDGTLQTARFDPGLYYNAGPARLPTQHQNIIGYGREFGVEFEVEVNTSRSAWYLPDQAAGPQAPIRLRRVVNDTRGYLAELLHKAASRGALDQELSGEDRARLLDLLRAYGDLNADGAFNGTPRSGYTDWPTAGTHKGQREERLELATILNRDAWAPLVFDENDTQQPTMLQPVGGMDRLPAAFHARLKDHVRLNSEVESLRNRDAGVDIVYRDRKTGRRTPLRVDYAVVTLTLPLLAKVENILPAETRAAIASVAYDTASKIAWQSPRFWEREDFIYGGISFLKHEVGLLWYPSGGFHKPEGILIAGYLTGDNARQFAAKRLEQRLAISREAVEQVHPGHGQDLQRGVTVSWNQQAFSAGSWVHWEELDNPVYQLLSRPEGRIHFAGDYLGRLGAWQEGAVASAHLAVAGIAAGVTAHAG